jgi:FixJ family two-component response regulator
VLRLFTKVGLQMQSTRHEANIAARLHLSVKHEFQSPANECGADLSGNAVYLIDDDLSVLETLSTFLCSVSRSVICFGSAAEYLEHGKQGEASCLIIDMQLPDNSGPVLQRQIAREKSPAVIFITDRPDVAGTVLAMKAGAVQVLTKPLNQSALVEAVSEAFVQDRKWRFRNAELMKLQQRFSLLTPREREVVPLIVGGLLNKQAASMLGISEVTFQIHRSQVMRKMLAGSVAELVRMAFRLRIPYWEGRLPESGAAQTDDDANRRIVLPANSKAGSLKARTFVESPACYQ